MFDKAELAAFETLMRPRFEAAGAEPSSWPYRRTAEMLSAIYVAQRDIPAYVALAEQTGLKPEDCLAVAKPMVGRKSADALGRVERSSADGPWSER